MRHSSLFTEWLPGISVPGFHMTPFDFALSKIPIFAAKDAARMRHPNPASPSFNTPNSVFTNHPRQMVLVLKYSF
jgi:hypothetical protein